MAVSSEVDDWIDRDRLVTHFAAAAVVAGKSTLLLLFRGGGSHLSLGVDGSTAGHCIGMILEPAESGDASFGNLGMMMRKRIPFGGGG